MTIFDFAAHHAALKQNPNYAVHPQILQQAEWRPGGTGHIFTDKSTDEPFIGMCSYLEPKFRAIEKAKYQFVGGRTHSKNGFDEDFARTHALLNNIQNTIVVSHNKKDMLLDVQSMCFARNIFEKREHAVPDSPTASHCTVFLEDLENPSDTSNSTGEVLKMDEETANWPVDDKFSNDIANIKPFYKAVPLPVYDKNDMFIEPANVNKALCNAVTEIHFTLHHTYLPKNTPLQDSFHTNIEQILILQGGKSAMKIYTSDPCAGPVKFTTHHTPPPPKVPPAKRSHIEESKTTKGKEKEKIRRTSVYVFH
ncbi:hypothetical protein DFJ58DRAFT_726566 [Suillus subalutaceus]|uniref:uncharacterized protein n=1 Tax=Suillus subalutaceus TaxID=48586 RepID=UPI001B87678E|nr:uncharacterized protein DFJ58DRAFT_726566 [Suillus subalutaceus]KAG1858775.1 hypothetical protein DFJ58DRAFT_726566 [Suillus subalutaceus]